MINVVGSEEVHYENILAFTNLPEKTDLKEIKFYHIVNNSKIPVDFDAFDKDNNGLIDYIEWIVPSLSNQTYELILISKAEHLDSSRNFISDIYEQVKALDNIWSEQINDSEYVRVTFEKNLTNVNDITIYPRTTAGTPRIEVYENNKTDIIATFESLKDNEYNKVYLTKLGQGNSYDNETEILTKNGWKYFYKLDNEEVATLNQETNKLEWQLPSKEHTFDYGGEMYKIIFRR